MQQKIFPLEGQVQPYNWGGFTFIPQLLGKEENGRQPSAEYWLGAHPNYPGFVQAGDVRLSLDRFISLNPEEVLGQDVARTFGALPFLLKVLDVRQMLSIQVHPSKAAAAAAFADEDKAGIPVSAPHRNYKDRNHKPELMVALGDFWLLHGFKAETALLQTLSEVPEFQCLAEAFQNGSYRGLYEKVMLLEPSEVDRMLSPLVARIRPLYARGVLPKSSADFWAARAVETFCQKGQYDRGIFSIYFFNLLHLRRGEGIYQPAGMPHAYLEGQNVEIMANSDNVLRAGLTDKHIDVPELLKHTRFEATLPSVLGSAAGTERETCFQTEAAEFELRQYRLAAGEELQLQAGSSEILLALWGSLSVQAGSAQRPLGRGASLFLAAGTPYTVTAGAASELFRATVPGK
ncbi:mannose-6-phosphate isomerase, class I [Paraflavisolibacter sp. H34]|uniref:mannose-6-phosphate isomerase, class I n=1 Tax=Huijunlia imazamoxiresistens TaxID=3127457 RepID=UPI00301A8BDB